MTPCMHPHASSCVWHAMTLRPSTGITFSKLRFGGMSINIFTIFHLLLGLVVEHPFSIPKVEGSRPSGGNIFSFENFSNFQLESDQTIS